MKGLLIAKSTTGYQATSYKKSAKYISNLDLTVSSFENLVFKYDKFILSDSNTNLMDFDFIIVSENQEKKYLVNAVYLYGYLNNIRILNQNCFNVTRGNFDKVQQIMLFKFGGVPFSETIFPAKNAEVDLDEDWVVKPFEGSQGQDVFLGNEIQDENKIADFILQKRIHSSFDIRAIMLNGELLGAIKRQNNEKFVNNYSKGGSVEPYRLNDQELNVAKLSMKALGLEYGGVDLMVQNGKSFVLEVNRGAQFKAMQECYPNLSVPSKVLTYLSSSN